MKYLGIDYGKRKIGLAVSEGRMAFALRVVEIGGLGDVLNKVKVIIREEGIDKVVVGVPDSGESKSLAGKFIHKLMDDGIEVVGVDETLSSYEAKKLMIEVGISKKRRIFEDAYAAQIILQNFLDGLSA